jgi:hypothetical protein
VRMMEGVAFVGVFLSPALLLLAYCWRVWVKEVRGTGLSDFRKTASYWSLLFATACIFLELTFLVHEFRGMNAASFVVPPQGISVVISRSALILWVVTIGTAIVGRGKLRILTVGWCVVMAVCTFVCVWMGSIY